MAEGSANALVGYTEPSPSVCTGEGHGESEAGCSPTESRAAAGPPKQNKTEGSFSKQKCRSGCANIRSMFQSTKLFKSQVPQVSTRPELLVLSPGRSHYLENF